VKLSLFTEPGRSPSSRHDYAFAAVLSSSWENDDNNPRVYEIAKTIFQPACGQWASCRSASAMLLATPFADHLLSISMVLILLMLCSENLQWSSIYGHSKKILNIARGYLDAHGILQFLDFPMLCSRGTNKSFPDARGVIWY
jgi:hypothetical protein